MKKLSAFAIVAFIASTLFISSCKKSSSDTPTPTTPPFTNGASFLAGTYTVRDSDGTSHNVITYNSVVTASGTQNNYFSISNFHNVASCVLDSGIYQGSSSIYVKGSSTTSMGGGNVYLSSPGTITSSTAPIKIKLTYSYQNGPYTTRSGNVAFFTHQ